MFGLGLGELLVRRCFGLIGPHLGSDATLLIGSYCNFEQHSETGELGVCATFKKRYITLAPVAGVVGLGLNLMYPHNLLQGKGNWNVITKDCAWVLVIYH